MKRLGLLIVVSACSSNPAAPPQVDAPPPPQDAGPCTTNSTGLLHAQPLTVGSLDRHYMLYVPTSYTCSGAPMPLVIDFHGTWSGVESDNGEEFYALDGMIAAAEAGGFIVARPRSLSSVEGGTNVYRWDENPGDYVKNKAFAHQLVTYLETLYTIDPARVYAMGFSSGTGMAAQFLADDPQVFSGYAYVGGGYFPGEAPPAVNVAPATRMYGVSGYRDYLYTDEEALLGLLDARGYTRANYFKRTDTNGHELYGWHYREMFDWIDRGVRPAPGTLAATWTAETLPAVEDLTALASDGEGGWIATGATGGIFHRDAAASWTQVASITNNPALAGVCMLPTGQGVAVGEAQVAHTVDHGATWATDVTIPQFVPGYFTVPVLNAVGCSASKLVTVGYWNAANSADAVTWTETAAPLTDAPTLTAQGAQVKVSAAGTWVATGYYYLARSTDGVTFTGIEPPASLQWLMGIASAPGGHWWVSGEAGTIFTSSDDGVTWSQQTVPTVEDLYAISFADALHGIVVGSHGAALVTSDGGATWVDRSTGLDAYIGDITWLDATTALIVGGNGTAATTQVD